MPHSAARPPVPIRMIALDLDGTLLRSDKTISPKTRKALHDAHARGIEIVLASGRMTFNVEKVVNMMEMDMRLICYNGAIICDRRAANRHKLFYKPLDASVARELYYYGRERQCHVNFYHEEVILIEDQPHTRRWVELHQSRTSAGFKIVESLEHYLHFDPAKLLFISDPEVRDQIARELTPRLAGRANVIRTDPEYLEFVHPSVDKGSALKILAGNLGVALEQIMAIGDGENDVPMLAACGWGVAVQNAVSQCKAAAKVVAVNSNDQDAVAEAIERWVLT